jgi:hypothetical protein
MFATSFYLLEGGISKREVGEFWARGDRGRMMVETRRIKMEVPVNGWVRLSCAQAHEADTWAMGTPGAFIGVRNSRSQL